MDRKAIGAWTWAGLGLWGLYAVVICAIVVAGPAKHSLIPFYDQAIFDFWARRAEPANFIHGYYYLPASQVLFSPFAYAGLTAGGIGWRLVAFGLMTLASWRWAQVLVPHKVLPATALILALLIASSSGVMRNGQFDGPTWALMALGGAEVALGGWWRAALALGLALALKPTGLVPILLMGVIWPQLGLRLIAVVAGVLALPFVNPDPGFVAGLYRSEIHQLVGALPEPGRWNDLANSFAYFGLPIPYKAMTVVRLAAGVAALALAWLASRRLPRETAAFVALGLCVVYLLLFNPRTEGSGYIGLGLVAAPLAARLLLEESRRAAAITLIVLCVVLGLPGLTPGLMSLFGIWLKPLLALLFLALSLIPRALDARRWEPVALAPA